MNIRILRRLDAALRRWGMWCLAGILPVLSAAQASIVIDFGYRITPAGTPLTQVYNNGRRTYFILAEDTDARTLREMAGSIRVTRDGKVYPLSLDLSSAHPSIAGVPERIALNVGGRQTTVTYIGNLERPVAAKGPAVEKALPMKTWKEPFIRKTPVPETREDVAEESPAPDSGQAAEASPPAVPEIREAASDNPAPPILAVEQPSIRSITVQEAAPGNEEGPSPGNERGAEAPPAPILATREALPDSRVAKMVAREEGPASGAPPAGAENRPDESVGAEDADVAEYKVRIPFAMGKTTLGKEGEKAMVEIAQIGPIAREIRIRAPGDPGSAFQRAHGRAAEIHRLLARAGLVRQRISIEAVEAVPDGKVVHAEVALIVDLGQTKR